MLATRAVGNRRGLACRGISLFSIRSHHVLKSPVIPNESALAPIRRTHQLMRTTGYMSTSKGKVGFARRTNQVMRTRYMSTSKREEAIAAAEDSASVLEKAAANTESITPRPSSRQLRLHCLWEAAPMFTFGFMEQSIMIYAGNAIDCTIGVWFGLSTLTAAAFGNMISNFVGLATGGTVERLAMNVGLPSPGLTEAQRSLKVVHRVGFAGTLVGAMLGCALGMIHLFFIDTDKSAILKLQAITQEQEIAFEVECSNKVRNDATAITVRGPDVDGILASMTAALSASGYSVLELRGTHHKVRDDGGVDENGLFTMSNDGTYEDTFIVRPRGSTTQVPDDDLEELGHTILAACKDPLSSHSLKAQVQDLRADNEALIERVLWLEQALEEKQIKVERRDDVS